MRKIIFVAFWLLGIALLGLSPAYADEAAQAVMETVPGSDLVGVLLGYLPASWGEWVTLVVTICAAIAVVLPAPKANSNVVWCGVYWLVQVLALNKGRATNAQDAKTTVINRVG